MGPVQTAAAQRPKTFLKSPPYKISKNAGETREEQLVYLLLGVVVRHPQPMFSVIESPRKLISDRAIVSNLSA